MPIPQITAPARPQEHDFLLSAQKAHELALYDFPVIFDHYWAAQYVFKTPAFFLMGGHDPDRGDAWLVWWAELHPSIADQPNRVRMLKTLLRCVPYHKPFIGWARTLKGRRTVKYYSTERLVRFTQKPARHHA